MPYVKAQDGTEIYYKDWGTGAPVILIHGWPLSSEMWEHQAQFLAHNGLRVISYDRRGFGRSSQPWGGYDYNTMAADLHSLMEQLDLRGAALVGFSMGGGEVVRYLARYGSARVSRAALISSVVPFMLKTDSNPDGTPLKQFDTFVEQLTKDRPAFLTEFGPQFYGRSVMHHTVSEPWLQFTQQMALYASPKATIDCVRAFGETDFRADCAQITVPTLIIHGTGDTTVPIDAAGRSAAKLIANSTLIEYDGEPHGLFATVPDRLNADLLEFLGDPRPALSDPVLS